MRSVLQITLLATLLAGCAAQQPAVSPAVQVQIIQPIEAPSTSMIATHQKSLNAYHVLLTPDTPDFFFDRNEKFVYGDLPIAGISSFTTYTYDAQSIATPGGSGYRYRWVVQSGVSAPPAP